MLEIDYLRADVEVARQDLARARRALDESIAKARGPLIGVNTGIPAAFSNSQNALRKFIDATGRLGGGTVTLYSRRISLCEENAVEWNAVTDLASEMRALLKLFAEDGPLDTTLKLSHPSPGRLLVSQE